jgi:hypothetical protein
MVRRAVRDGTGRKVTAVVSHATYAKLVAAKLYTGKTLIDLMEEGLEMIAEHYRNQRARERSDDGA